jgi:hypothetical protein
MSSSQSLSISLTAMLNAGLSKNQLLSMVHSIDTVAAVKNVFSLSAELSTLIPVPSTANNIIIYTPEADKEIRLKGEVNGNQISLDFSGLLVFPAPIGNLSLLNLNTSAVDVLVIIF